MKENNKNEARRESFASKLYNYCYLIADVLPTDITIKSAESDGASATYRKHVTTEVI
jgi:hypothetical protein